MFPNIRYNLQDFYKTTWRMVPMATPGRNYRGSPLWALWYLMMSVQEES